MGPITNNERYNQIIDIWTHTQGDLHPDGAPKNDRQGLQPIYMMMDSGRGDPNE